MRMQIDTRKAQMPGVPRDVCERDYSRPALQRIQPISRPRIFADVAFAAPPDHHAVSAVEKDRKPYPKRLEEDDHWQAAQELHLVGVGFGPVNGGGIRDQDVFD